MTIDECRTALKDAQTAYHNLMTGGMARVVVDQAGSRVEFTAANRQDLYLYINRLQSVCPVTAETFAMPSGPLTFTF